MLVPSLNSSYFQSTCKPEDRPSLLLDGIYYICMLQLHNQQGDYANSIHSLIDHETTPSEISLRKNHRKGHGDAARDAL